jgi:gas vesicle protein
MNNEVNKSGSNFFSGFLVGALVGAAIVFFLGTKKGKRILKIISEKGLNNVSNMLDKAESTAELEEVFDEPSFAKVTEGQGKKLNREDKIIVDDKPKTKRFFRGISKRLN